MPAPSAGSRPRLCSSWSTVALRTRGAAAAAGVLSVYRPMGPFREAVPDDPRRARERYDAALAAEIADARPDLIVQAGWMHLFTSAFLDRFPGMVVNLHPALPGAFPGAHAIDDAWAAHETDGLDHTGVMVHLVPDEGVDDGPVLASQRVPITADDTVGHSRPASTRWSTSCSLPPSPTI